MKAITTKFLGPTDTLGSRVKAYDLDGNQATLPWRRELNDVDNHKLAVVALCRRMGWDTPAQLAGGYVKGGMAWVFVDAESPLNIDLDFFEEG